MSPSPLRFWGKARPTRPGPAWHPVVYHSLDVAACALALLESGTSRPPSPWDQVALRPALAALVALHDLGKFSRPFQAKAEAHWPAEALGVFAGALPDPGHDSVGYALLRGELADVLDPVLQLWPARGRRSLLRALCGHHGRPPLDELSFIDELACPPCRTAARAFACEVAAVLGPPPLPVPGKRGPTLEWWLAGFTVLADWIGSAEAWFGYCEPTLSMAEYWQAVALPRARHAVRKAGLCPAASRPVVELRDLVGADVPASPVQALAASLDLGAHGPALVLVEDQTGSGKTEAALLLAHRLLASGRADGAFVALPTMATANAMYDRLAAAYRHLFADGAEPSLVLAHGNRVRHDRFQASILQEAADPGAMPVRDAVDETASAQCAAWIADDRRQTFLAQVGVGTIDQALLAVLPSRHAPLRLHGLHRRVLIVDEAHAYDAYMREELLRLVQFQSGLGGSTIILSATLPQKTRRELAAAYTQGADAAQQTPVRACYPLITVVRLEGLDELPCAGRDGLARRIAVQRLESPDAALARIRDAAKAGQAVAWIRNAVDDALEAHEALAAQGVIATLFHARFAMGHRQEIEQRVVARYGKRGKDRAGVVVSTQVLEQSLDIDFDLIVTDLAPIDLLIQRAGRLWRHARPLRPADLPRLLVLAPDPVDDPGAHWLGTMLRRTGFVYPNHALLWRTACVLFETGAIEAPGDVRRLVEAVYASVENAPVGLQRNAQEAEGKNSAHVSLARQNLLGWTEGYTRKSGAWESDVRTPTRLGEESVTLRLGCWDGAALRPMCDADEPNRAWALSEVRVARRLATDVPPASASLAEAERRVRSGWGRWDQEVPILALTADREEWVGQALRDTEARPVRYSSHSGLRFG